MLLKSFDMLLSVQLVEPVNTHELAAESGSTTINLLCMIPVPEVFTLSTTGMFGFKSDSPS